MKGWADMSKQPQKGDAGLSNDHDMMRDHVEGGQMDTLGSFQSRACTRDSPDSGGKEKVINLETWHRLDSLCMLRMWDLWDQTNEPVAYDRAIELHPMMRRNEVSSRQKDFGNLVSRRGIPGLRKDGS